IKQDSANLALAQEFEKTYAVFRAFCGARSPCLINILFINNILFTQDRTSQNREFYHVKS
ncbi:hypothetical protein, partial [Helicobacter pylori]|uniref:hypothetical protein n=1 Tax=Helicobacter pylori TaxID=210 RepID=UPI00196A6552